MQHRDYFEKEVRTVLCVRDLERSRNFYQQTLELVPMTAIRGWQENRGCMFMNISRTARMESGCSSCSIQMKT